MSLVLQSSGGGQITIQEPATASNFTQTLPAGTGTVVVGGVNSALVAGTAVASTSGTSIDFTSIPSWVRRITVMFNAVSTNGTSNILIQIGSGSVTNSGYVSQASGLGSGTGTVSSTTGFIVTQAVSAVDLYSGASQIVLQNGNSYISSGIFNRGGASALGLSAGLVTLSGTLDRVRITTVNGTDAFDAGSINILYE